MAGAAAFSGRAGVLGDHEHPDQPPSQAERLGATERAAAKEYLCKQASTLARRHSADDIILLGVLTDYHQHAALVAKGGHIESAESEMRELDQIPRTNRPELELAYGVSAYPVWALIQWLRGDCESARAGLNHAISAAEQLATQYGHRYLTAKRIHLAANLSRLLTASGDNATALGGWCFSPA